MEYKPEKNSSKRNLKMEKDGEKQWEFDQKAVLAAPVAALPVI